MLHATRNSKDFAVNDEQPHLSSKPQLSTVQLNSPLSISPSYPGWQSHRFTTNCVHMPMDSC